VNAPAREGSALLAGHFQRAVALCAYCKDYPGTRMYLLRCGHSRPVGGMCPWCFVTSFDHTQARGFDCYYDCSECIKLFTQMTAPDITACLRARECLSPLLAAAPRHALIGVKLDTVGQCAELLRALSTSSVEGGVAHGTHSFALYCVPSFDDSALVSCLSIGDRLLALGLLDPTDVFDSCENIVLDCAAFRSV